VRSHGATVRSAFDTLARETIGKARAHAEHARTVGRVSDPAFFYYGAKENELRAEFSQYGFIR
jgi:hypothetical protein